MKRLNVYEINGGTDGIIVAKSLKQAVKKIVKFNKPWKASPIVKCIKEENENYIKTGECSPNYAFVLTFKYPVPKKNEYKKSRIIGWCE